MERGRLLVSGPLSPTRNMALDEALLQRAEQPVLRLYTWNPAGLSLGYFQSVPDPLPEVCRQLEAVVVRRPTGGGAILHRPGEATFSLVLPRQLTPSTSPPVIYSRVAEALSDASRSLGYDFRLRAQGTDRPEDPFFCFDRTSHWDLLTPDGRKAAGFASRRTNRAFLVHGSIHPDTNLTYEKLSPHLSASFEAAFDLKLTPSEPTPEELRLVEELLPILQNPHQKYRTGRTHPRGSGGRRIEDSNR